MYRCKYCDEMHGLKYVRYIEQGDISTHYRGVFPICDSCLSYRESDLEILRGNYTELNILESDIYINDFERDRAVSSMCTTLARPLANIIRRGKKGFTDQDHKTHVALCQDLWDILNKDTNEMLLKLMWDYLNPEISINREYDEERK